MADSSIPPIIRRAFPDDAPPDPPEAEPDRDDDDRHEHHVFEVPLPVFAIYSDGSRVGNGWLGHLLDLWFSAASLVTIGATIWAIWSWFGAFSLVLAAVYAVLTALVAMGGAAVVLVLQALWDWWRRRRKAGGS